MSEKLQTIIKWVARGLIIAALLCWFLPFSTVACQGEEMARGTGFQMTFGAFGKSEVEEVKEAACLNGWLLMALILAAGAAVVAFVLLKKSAMKLVAAGLSFTAFLMMLIYKGSFRSLYFAELEDYAEFLTVKHLFGYHLATILLLLAALVLAGLFVLGLIGGKGGEAVPKEKPKKAPKAAPAANPEGWECALCGKMNSLGSAFCTGCGASKAMAEKKPEPPKAPEVKPVAGWQCASCGKMNPEAALFCSGCGAKKAEAPAAPAPANVCPQCGAPRNDGKFCMKCGYRFE